MTPTRASTSPFQGEVEIAAACCGYSLIRYQWICSSREGKSPSAVRICTVIMSSVGSRLAAIAVRPPGNLEPKNARAYASLQPKEGEIDG